MKFNFNEYFKQINNFLLESDDVELTDGEETDEQKEPVSEEPTSFDDKSAEMQSTEPTVPEKPQNDSSNKSGMKAFNRLKSLYTELETVLNEAGIKSLAEALKFSPTIENNVSKSAEPKNTAETQVNASAAGAQGQPVAQ
jgi:hypothetical protein